MWQVVNSRVLRAAASSALLRSKSGGLSKPMGTMAPSGSGSHIPMVWIGDHTAPLAANGNEKSVLPPAENENETALPPSDWSEFTVERWRSAVYVNLSYFAQLYVDTQNFITDIAKHIKLRGHRVTLIEVGCGTGEFIWPTAEHFRLAIGVDFNEQFIQYCNQNIPAGKEERINFIHGDACELVDVMMQKAPAHIWSDTRIVACIGNTMGIIPQEMKEQVYRQMTELAGEDGVVILGYWNAAHFGDACQNFYHANPQLCGPFSGDSVDFNTATITTPPPWNYRSHWTGVEEAREVLRSLNLEEIIVEERGKGVLVAARAKARSE